MKVAEARKLIVEMEVSADIMLKAEAMLDKYGPDEDIPDSVLDEILKVVDAGFNPEEVVKDSDEMPQL